MYRTRTHGLAMCLGLLLNAAAGHAQDIVIHAGTLIDGVSDTPRRQVSILIRDDKILSVESGFAAATGAEVIDLSNATVMPGFIDCHVHISAMLPSRSNATEYWLTHSDTDRALDAAVFVRQMLQQGFTSARDVGGGDDTLPTRNLPLAVKSGVKIAYGTDLGQGDHTMEFGLLIGNGMTPIQALNAATRNAADLIGAADRIGSVQAGRYADLVATSGNPLDNPEQFKQISFVMKGGKVYKRSGLETVPPRS